MLKTTARFLLALSLLSTLNGCYQPGASSGPQSVCYLDLVAIAKALGRDATISQQQGAALEQLTAQLQGISSDLKQEIEDMKSRLGENPKQEEKELLTSLTVNAGEQLQQSKLVARQKYALYEQQLLAAFQAEVRTHAQSIARSRGATAVAVLGNNVLWYAPSSDITDEVIARMRAQDSAERGTSRPDSGSRLDASNNSSGELQSPDGPADNSSEKSGDN